MYPGEEATHAIIQHMTKHKDINRNKQILIQHFNFSLKTRLTTLNSCTIVHWNQS